MKKTFSRESRLKTAAQFKKVFNETKKKLTASGITMFFCENNLSYPRLGVIVPKKRIKKANKRNRFKRVVREIFRLKQNSLRKIDLVVLATNQPKESGKNKTLAQTATEQLEKLEHD